MNSVVLLISAILCIASNSAAQVPGLVEGWPYLTRTEGWTFHATPKFSFYDSIDSSAVFFNTISHEIDKFHMDASFHAGWPIMVDSLLFPRTPIVVDIDHDGRDEMAIICERRSASYPYYYLYSLLFLIDDDGSVMPGFPVTCYKPKPLNVADLDGDGEYEILTFSVHEGQIQCIDRFGSPIPGWPIDLAEDVFLSGWSCAIGDLDLDGTNEYIFTGFQNIYAYRYDGSMMAGFPICVYDDSFYHDYWGWCPSLADIDMDGYLEIMISAGRFNDDWSYSGYAAVYEHTGEMKAGWPLMFPGATIFQTPIPADINGDNILELGFSVAMGQGTFFVDVDGNNLPGWPSYLERAMAELVTVDIDGDGDCEIFTDYNTLYADSIGPDSTYYYGYSYFYGYDHLGQVLPDYPLIVNGWYYRRPATFALHENTDRLYMGLLTDIDLTPWLDLDTAYLEIYIFPDSTGPPDQWPMLGHDNLMTRNYNFVDYATGVKEETEIIPKTYVLKQNYPNPFNNSTIIEFALPEDEFVRLTVYDILGRAVSEPLNARLKAGQHSVTLNLNDASSGMYFYLLTTEKAKISRKMVLLH